MANITRELQAIEEAIYGEEVRGSIHDAISKINDVCEESATTSQNASITASAAKTQAENAEAIAEISFGTDVTSTTSPITGFVKGESYFNNVTNDLWQCNGIGWTLVGNLKGVKGDTGNEAPRITSVLLTSKVGLVSTYTITLSDTSSYTFQVSDGQSGTGTGDMLKSVYDKDNSGIVDSAETVVDKTSGRAGVTSVLVELSQDSDGDLNYKGNKIKGGSDVAIATTTKAGIVKPHGDSFTIETDGTLKVAPKFVSNDASDLSSMTTYENVDVVATNESPYDFFNKITKMFKNIRYMIAKLGSTDISASTLGGGDGTVTGCIGDLYDKVGESGGTFFDLALSVSADSELVGAKCRIYQVLSGANSPYYQSKKITSASPTDWSAKSLGTFSVFTDDADLEQIGTFTVDSFSIAPATIVLTKAVEEFYIFNGSFINTNDSFVVSSGSGTWNGTTLERNGTSPVFYNKIAYSIKKYKKINFTISSHSAGHTDFQLYKSDKSGGASNTVQITAAGTYSIDISSVTDETALLRVSMGGASSITTTISKIWLS